MSTFTQIFERNRYELPQLMRKSRTWYDQEVTKIRTQGRMSAYYVMRGASEQNRSMITPGEMYMFYYDAKMKETLPYWDQFPLVFPFRKLKGVNNVAGFLGLNLHYLSYPLRVRLLDRLMDFRTNTRMDETTRLKYSWSTIANLSRYELAKPCVHHYLLPHVKSTFKKVDANDWATALMLPVEKFTGASKQQVWANSIK